MDFVEKFNLAGPEVEFLLQGFPCAFTIDLKKEIEEFCNVGGPQNFPVRITSMSVFNDIEYWKECEASCIKNASEVASFASKLRIGHGAASNQEERIWWALNSNEPNGNWDEVATEMRYIFKDRSQRRIFFCTEPCRKEN